MIGRTVVMAALLAGLTVPGSAGADAQQVLCVPAPVDTIGVHVEVGDEEVHVPAISNIQLCALWWPLDTTGQADTPVSLTMYPGCGFPCFTFVVEQGEWTALSTRVEAYATYEVDGVPTYLPLANVPIVVGIDNPNPVCVAVGNPIPDCPENSLAVPLPIP